MKYLFPFVLMLAVLTHRAAAEPTTEPSIIPRPAVVTMKEGTYHAATAITPDIKIDPSAKLGDEGYKLTVASDGVHITASTETGAFYAQQTLLQLQPDPKVAADLPCLEITDQPLYRWRGMMLDVSRHFRDVAYVHHFLDIMAMEKMNTFHWHLTDDQGWRIEIKKYPKLTEVGAWRDDGHGGKYGGFYTQDQIREVVAYAAARHITVVPEIEMPGHCTAALASYPEFGCNLIPTTVSTTWGGAKDIFCPGKPKTFDFLEDVLGEVIELFPGPFIHIGGDEVQKRHWRDNAACQALMKKENLKNEDELQSYFVKRIDAFLTSKGKRTIGWDEILQGGLAPGATVMSWRGTKGGIAAAKLDHDVVMCPESHCYFDHYQADRATQPPAIDSDPVFIKTVYSFLPNANLTPQQAAHVLGAQGNLWAEYLDSDHQCDYMAFPREFALAEALWTPVDRHDWADFKRRLPATLRRLDELHVAYFHGWQEDQKMPATRQTPSTKP